MLSNETMRRLMIAYNSGHLFESNEFQTDAQRIVLVTKIIDRWVNDKPCNYQLLMNHITIIDNTFGEVGIYALYEYVSNFPSCVPSLLSILYYMGRVKKPAVYDEDLLKELEVL